MLNKLIAEWTGNWWMLGFLFVLFLVIYYTSHKAFEETEHVLIDMRKIMMIESSGNHWAYNKRDNSIGAYQITPICREEWNNFHPNNEFREYDLWNHTVNYKIADWYINERIPQMLDYYNVPDTTKNRIVAYNAGISYLTKKKEIPDITKHYIKKYERMM